MGIAHLMQEQCNTHALALPCFATLTIVLVRQMRPELNRLFYCQKCFSGKIDERKGIFQWNSQNRSCRSLLLKITPNSIDSKVGLNCPNNSRGVVPLHGNGRVGLEDCAVCDDNNLVTRWLEKSLLWTVSKTGT